MEILFKPTDKQKEFYDNVLTKSQYQRVLAYGGSRSGKTFLFLYTMVLRALKYPGSRHICLRRTRRSIELSLWNETMPKVIGLFPGLKQTLAINQTDLSIVFPNGAEIFFDGLDDPKRVDSILGREYVTIFFNEVSEQIWYVVDSILSRLAQKISGCTAKAFFDCNPPGRGHWSYTLFFRHLDPADRKTPMQKQNMYAVRQLNPEDNRANIADGYIEDTLGSMGEARKKRFLYGEYGEDNELTVFPVAPDGYFDDDKFRAWTKAVGVENVRFTAGCDFALSDADAFCIIAYAVKSNKYISTDDLRNLNNTMDTQPGRENERYLIYEYKARRETTEAFAKEIKTGMEYARKLAHDYNLASATVDFIYCDHGKTNYDLYQIYGLPTRNAFKADKQSGIELLHDEVSSGSFRIRQQGNADNEFSLVVWKVDPDSGLPTREIDDKSYHPDLMDAILYAMRYVWYYETKKTV